MTSSLTPVRPAVRAWPPGWPPRRPACPAGRLATRHGRRQGRQKRSYISTVTATDQPPPSSVISRSSSMCASVKNTSLNPCCAVHLVQRPDLDAGLADVDDEEAQAPVLGHLPVGPGQQHPAVGVLGPRGPHLLAVDRPAAAVVHRPGLRAGQVRPGPGLGEELAPQLLAAHQRGQEPGLLLLAAVDQQHRPAQQLAQPGGRGQRPRLGEGRPHARGGVGGQPLAEPSAGQVGKPHPDSASRAHQARTVRPGSQLALSQPSASSLAAR